MRTIHVHNPVGHGLSVDNVDHSAPTRIRTNHPAHRPPIHTHGCSHKFRKTSRRITHTVGLDHEGVCRRENSQPPPPHRRKNVRRIFRVCFQPHDRVCVVVCLSVPNFSIRLLTTPGVYSRSIRHALVCDLLQTFLGATRQCQEYSRNSGSVMLCQGSTCGSDFCQQGRKYTYQ